MIDVTDAFRAIEKALRVNFPDIKVENSDIKNPPRPSFYINDITQYDARAGASFVNNAFSFDVIYFGNSLFKGNTTLISVQAALSKILLNPLTCTKAGNTLFFEVSQLYFNSNKADYVLNTTFNIEYIQRISEFDLNNNSENMEELQLN